MKIQQSMRKMASVSSERSPLDGQPRAAPVVEMAVGDAYMDSLGQPRQPPVVAMEVGAALLGSLDAQARASRALNR